MKLKELGEFGLIKKLASGIKTDESVIVGIGDDAAVLEYSKKEYLLLTCDMLVEDVHFLRQAKPDSIGWKVVCCSVSDIASMGGEPKWLVISIGLPKDLSLEYIEGIYSGIKKASNKFNVNIVGGDTVSSGKLVIDVAMIGSVKKENLCLRSQAKSGDAIFVTGALGGAVKTGRHLKFTPRFKEAQILVNNFDINAMMDISDGLSSDLGHILEASNMGAVIYEKHLPIAKGSNLESALCEGEDFELLFTVPQKELIPIKKRFARFCKSTTITHIGQITRAKEGFKLIHKDNSVTVVKPKGYNHFA